MTDETRGNSWISGISCSPVAFGATLIGARCWVLGAGCLVARLVPTSSVRRRAGLVTRPVPPLDDTSRHPPRGQRTRPSVTRRILLAADGTMGRVQARPTPTRYEHALQTSARASVRQENGSRRANGRMGSRHLSRAGWRGTVAGGVLFGCVPRQRSARSLRRRGIGLLQRC